MPRDQLHRRLGRLRSRDIGPRDLRRVLPCEQRRICCPQSPSAPRRCGTPSQCRPAATRARSRSWRPAHAAKRASTHRVVGEEGRHQQRACLVRVVGDPPHQRQRVRRRRQHQLLPLAQTAGRRAPPPRPAGRAFRRRRVSKTFCDTRHGAETAAELMRSSYPARLHSARNQPAYTLRPIHSRKS